MKTFSNYLFFTQKGRVFGESQCIRITAHTECPLLGSFNNAKIRCCSFAAATVRFCLMVSGARTQPHSHTHSHTLIAIHTHSRTNAQRHESLFSATTARTSVLVSGPHSFLYPYLYPCICALAAIFAFAPGFFCGYCWPSCRWRPFTISKTYPRWRRSFSCTIALFGGAHIMDSQRDVAALATKSLCTLLPAPAAHWALSCLCFPIFPLFRSPSGSTCFCFASSIALQLTDVMGNGCGWVTKCLLLLLTAIWFAE